MNHPELVVIPILMLVNYILNILGAKYVMLVYRNHFVIPTHELNPLWSKSVDQIQWFNLRYFGLTALVFLLLLVLDQTAVAIEGVVPLVLGTFFGVLGAVCSRNLTNLLVYCYLNRHPGEISGQVQLSMKLIYKISQFTYIGWLPLLALVAALVRDFYTTGAALGLLVLVLVHSLWLRKAKEVETTSRPSTREGAVESEA